MSDDLKLDDMMRKNDETIDLIKSSMLRIDDVFRRINKYEKSMENVQEKISFLASSLKLIDETQKIKLQNQNERLDQLIKRDMKIVMSELNHLKDDISDSNKVSSGLKGVYIAIIILASIATILAMIYQIIA